MGGAVRAVCAPETPAPCRSAHKLRLNLPPGHVVSTSEAKVSPASSAFSMSDRNWGPIRTGAMVTVFMRKLHCFRDAHMYAAGRLRSRRSARHGCDSAGHGWGSWGLPAEQKGSTVSKFATLTPRCDRRVNAWQGALASGLGRQACAVDDAALALVALVAVAPTPPFGALQCSTSRRPSVCSTRALRLSTQSPSLQYSVPSMVRISAW